MSSYRRVIELREHPAGVFIAKFEVTKWRPTVEVRLLSIAETGDRDKAESDAIAALSPQTSVHPHDLQAGHRFEPV
jgi:hypothetical protein